MSTVLIQTTDKEFNHYLSKAYADGYAKAIEEVQTPKSEWVDEAEALTLLGCQKSTLDKRRHQREIEFRGARGSLTYSRKSIEAFLESKRVKSR